MVFGDMKGNVLMSEKLTFRYAERNDIPLILQFIKELAAYEKLINEVVADEKTLEEWRSEERRVGKECRL